MVDGEDLGPSMPAGFWCVNLQQGNSFPGLEHTTDSARSMCSPNRAGDGTCLAFGAPFIKVKKKRKKKKQYLLVSAYSVSGAVLPASCHYLV